MKSFFFIGLFLLFSRAAFSQCPTAGSDSAATYCKDELFDLANLRSADADSGGIFFTPAWDTMTTTTTSLTFPGQYNFHYVVSDTGCVNDTARYVITIISTFCWSGTDETVLEQHRLIRSNPASEQLVLYDANYDRLEIYEASGRCVIRMSDLHITSIDISQLEKGNYLLVLEKEQTRQFQRFLKY